MPEISKKLIFKWLYIKNIIDENSQLTKLGKVIENELKPLILYWQDLPFKSSAYMFETLKKGMSIFQKYLKNHILIFYRMIASILIFLKR